MLGEKNEKERTDHRHHAIDAVVIASTSRSLYTAAVKQIERNKLIIDRPYPHIRDELHEKLNRMIVSHVPQRKLSGGLHEETGAGYIEKHGGLVYRKILNQEFTIKNAMRIVDEQVKTKVLEHIENYGDSKKAFNEENLKALKLGKNPIKRVRVLQSDIKTTKNKTAESVLEKTKFGVKDKSGKIFKYMSYGNIHHVEIICHKDTGEIKGEFVTMMEAHRRAMTGTKSARKRGIHHEEIIKTKHGEDWTFVMALHRNDTVSVENDNGERVFYKVQTLDMAGKIQITLHTDGHKSTEIPKENKILKAITTLMSDQYKLKKYNINAIGYFIDD